MILIALTFQDSEEGFCCHLIIWIDHLDDTLNNKYSFFLYFNGKTFEYIHEIQILHFQNVSDSQLI